MMPGATSSELPSVGPLWCNATLHQVLRPFGLWTLLVSRAAGTDPKICMLAAKSGRCIKQVTLGVAFSMLLGALRDR